MRYAVLINENSGNVRTYGVKAFQDLISQKLGDQLVFLRHGKGESLAKAYHQALKNSPDCIAVVAGDGTARFIAELSLKTKIPLIFLPGGTMNVLPLKLNAPNSLAEAVEALAQNQVEQNMLDIGTANDKPFLVAVGFGFMPIIASWREELRTQDPPTDWLRLWRQFLAMGQSLFSPTIRIILDNQRPLFPSPGALVSVGDADTLTPGREPENLDKLEVVTVSAKNWWEIAIVLVNALINPHWRQHSAIDTFYSLHVEIRKKWRYVRVTLDGEPTKLRSPVILKYERDALPVYAFIKSNNKST